MHKKNTPAPFDGLDSSNPAEMVRRAMPFARRYVREGFQDPIKMDARHVGGWLVELRGHDWQDDEMDICNAMDAAFAFGIAVGLYTNRAAFEED